MGNCGSAPTDDGDAKKRSQAIDRTLEDDSRKLRKECKILLLGAPRPSVTRLASKMI